MARVKNRGRQKITIVKIKNDTTRQVTFSKRHNGLFKKANEICTLSGAEVGAIVLSPRSKVYSFGYPSIESIVERYEAQHPPPPEDGKNPGLKPRSHTNLQKLKGELDAAITEMDAERKRGELLHQLAQASQNHLWWEAPIDDLNLYELEMLWEATGELHQIVAEEMMRKLTISRELSASLPGNNSFENSGGFHSYAEPSTTDDYNSFNYDFQFVAGASSPDYDNFSKGFDNRLHGHE